MSYLKHLFLAISFVLGTSNVFSQVAITADKTSSCDSLTVKFAILPMSDTISSIVWDYDDGISISGDSISTHFFSSPGKFNVTAIINGTSTVNSSSPVYIYSSPDARFASSDSLELGSYSFVFQSLPQLVDSFTYSYDWQLEDVNIASTNSLVYTFPEAGVFKLSLVVSNEFGCLDTEIKNIVAEDILDAPNVFTPNFDGFNDYFEVKTNGVNLYEFSVYSRSGMLVFKSETPVIQWDGRSSSGQLLRSGVYYYVIRQLDGDPLMEKIGFVQLLH